MKTIKSKFLVLSLILFTAIAFSSCDKDEYEWREGEIFMEEETISVPSNGIVTGTITLTKDWVKVMNGGRYDYIEDISYVKCLIDVYEGPYIDYLTFNILNTDIGFRYPIKGNQGATINDIEPVRKRFFEEVVEIIRRDGVAIIAVGGETNPNVKIKMDVYFELGAYVSF